ncbi:iron-sulfur cluster carrier protein ApbC [Thiomicrorhabdus lithotrophica]|uniref:Iron-sulfur cluster carrier protein n=1 Tax=Thiomicrorhabdus lithotrophica TaxID=2949997 RepID=A0ABY8CFV9_9GAMM|nr:iron-sulfur cluster carrier protein ApbC [Thiomicrorhabdus lithotrophica]WEJ63585.1 iron-sulfur cluster carrier protein ApbC [Thiomicrorhabdus lithotrophica]
MGILNTLFGNGISAELQETISQKLKACTDPTSKQDLESLKALSALQFKKGVLKLTVSLPYPCKSLWPNIEQNIKHELSQIDEIETIEIEFETKIVSHDAQKGVSPLPNIKNIIAIASGKGGVGKSTTSVNIALALQQEGANVGLLDADIYGPSIPTMLNIKEKPLSEDGKSMQPLPAYGLQVMSIGALIEEDSPMIWRGPIVTQTLTQLLKETNWSDLDYLVIDLPPGTGDVQLTLSQQIPVTGAVIVTTPQQVSLIDAKKGLKMFEKVEIPVLGIIENMSTHICSNCGHEEAIFGAHGGEEMAKQYKVDFLGALPLDKRIREEADQGKPTVTAEPSSEIAQKYRHMAHKISAQIGIKKRNYANVFPNIVIQNN